MALSFRYEGSLPPVLPSKVRVPSFQWSVTESMSLARVASLLGAVAMGSQINLLGTRLQAILLSPHHAGLAGLQFQRLLCVSRFSTMLLSPLPFDFRWGG